MTDKLNRQILELFKINLECEIERFFDILGDLSSAKFAHYMHIRGMADLLCV